nr:hypothetical protein [Sphingomonas bacterium]
MPCSLRRDARATHYSMAPPSGSVAMFAGIGTARMTALCQDGAAL